MSSANETRLNLGGTLFAIGAVLLIYSFISDSVIASFSQLIGIALAGCGAIIALPILLIDGATLFVRKIASSTEPDWDGEILHTDGSEHKIRYELDEKSCAWFVASDICIAAGMKRPNKGAATWCGVPLVTRGKNTCFSEEAVQAFLMPLAAKSHEANRLLLLIRNNVLRKLEKQRHADKMYG